MDLFRAPLRRSIVETQGCLLALRQPAKVLRTAIFISPLDLPTSKSIREIAFNPARLYDSGRSKFDP
jgi:hypothetical protein